MFYFSHLLYVIYWVLLIFHAPNFWKWFVGPCAIYLIEKIFRVARSLSEEGKTWVTMGVVLPSKVVSLVIRRPPHFTFKPGDYIFINIPVIATFEWHPFTIRLLYLWSFLELDFFRFCLRSLVLLRIFLFYVKFVEIFEIF